MKDFILDVSFDARDTALEELVQSRLFLTRSTGSSATEVNGTTTVSAYFDSAKERDDAAVEMRDLNGIELHATDRERVDWLERYQQSLEPLFIGEHFVVAPDASLIPSDTQRHALVVPQEQAFGTGSHETTSLCIEILETSLWMRRANATGSTNTRTTPRPTKVQSAAKIRDLTKLDTASPNWIPSRRPSATHRMRARRMQAPKSNCCARSRSNRLFRLPHSCRSRGLSN